MSFTYAVWNVKEGLAQPNEMPLMVEQIRDMDADVVGITDAYVLQDTKHGSDPAVLEKARSRLAALGYALFEVAYDDGWHHDRNAMLLSRLPGTAYAAHRYGRRISAEAMIDIPGLGPVRIVALHGIDNSRLDRGRQFDDFIASLGHNQLTIIGGDLNEMWRRWLLSPLIGTSVMQSALAHIPDARKRSVVTRLGDMTHGENLAKLARAGLRDADRYHRPTFSIPVQLDHIFVSNLLRTRFARWKRSPASDHRAIRAEIAA